MAIDFASMTAPEYYAAVADVVAANPEIVPVLAGTFELDLTADDAGVYHLCFDPDGTWDVGPGAYPDATVKIISKWGTMKDLMSGKLNSNVAMMTGKVKMKGDFKTALKLGKLMEL